MNLSQYLQQERGRQASLARAIGAHAPDICRWADGRRPIPVIHGAAIEAATEGLVTRQEMFPDDWHRIWPELVPALAPSSSEGEIGAGADAVEPALATPKRRASDQDEMG